jgi:glycosyltransferase involved in cell wall biosynthesis
MIKVSCLCPTYNRAPHTIRLVEEAIASFLAQDYPAKELIVLNDTPGQLLRYDHPEVLIVNTPFRCQTLGAKRIFLVGLASGELLCPWDDDDISLPWRLSRSVALLGDADYYNPQRYWFLDPKGLHHDHALGYAFNASIFRKTAWEELGGAPGISVAEDAVMDGKLRTRRLAAPSPLPLDDWFYIYRWGVSPVHLSGLPGDTFYGELGTRPIERGEFTLTPHWQDDYVAATRAHAARVIKKATAAA